MKKYTRVAIIGGGAPGVSLLYHLTKRGWTDVMLIERDELTAGSTWHAAGNCARFSQNLTLFRIRDYSMNLYQKIENDTQLSVGCKITGGLRPARDKERMDEYRYFESVTKSRGFNVEMVSPEQVKELHPFLNVGGYIGGLYDPLEGNVDPSQLTQSLAKGARDGGAIIQRHTAVTGVSKANNGNWNIVTDKGEIESEIVVNAAGLWAREVGQLFGMKVPIVPMQHHYLVTEPSAEIANLPKSLPLFRDGEESFYLRQEQDGLIIGLYESRPAGWAIDGTPTDFGMELLPLECDRIDATLELAMNRVPIIGSLGIKKTINGGITFSPDGHPLIGPAFGVDNYYYLTGFTAGIMEAGGAGMFLSEWIVDGHAPYDMSSFDPRRFGAFADQDYVLARAKEIYPKTYAPVYPFEELQSGRPIRKSPIYDKLNEAGAVWGSRFGWERANWFAPKDIPRHDVLSFRRTNWFEHVGNECEAVTKSCGIIDLTSFSKFEISGVDSESYLNRITTNKIPKMVGGIRLTHCLNDNGGIECEFTLVKTDDQRFYLTAASIAQIHHFDWLARQKQKYENVNINDITDEFGILVLAGPNSRNILSRLTDESLANNDFPWLQGKFVNIADRKILALRWNYTGELGWELHHAMKDQLHIYNRIMQYAMEYNIKNVGVRALEPLRMEKGYAAWSMELTSEYSPIDASLERFVSFDKGDFVGRKALIKQKEAGVDSQLVQLEITSIDCDALGSEPVYCNNRYVGMVTSGAYGYRVGKSLAFAYVKFDALSSCERCEVEILGDRFDAKIISAPPFDKENTRLRS